MAPAGQGLDRRTGPGAQGAPDHPPQLRLLAEDERADVERRLTSLWPEIAIPDLGLPVGAVPVAIVLRLVEFDPVRELARLGFDARDPFRWSRAVDHRAGELIAPRAGPFGI